jgi:hypothetical protein
VDCAKSSRLSNTAEYPPSARRGRLFYSKARSLFVPPKSLFGLGISSSFGIVSLLCGVGGSSLWMAEYAIVGDRAYEVLEEIEVLEGDG